MIRPARSVLLDGAFATILAGFALAGLRTTYAGPAFLVAGAVGLLVGLLASIPTLLFRQPVIAVVGTSIVGYFLVGSAVIDPAHAVAHTLPAPGTLREQSLATVTAWKDLLTTLPPIAAHGTTLVIPLVLGLFGTAAGLTLATRLRWAAAPVAAPVAVEIAVIALGTHQPGARLLDSVAFAGVALCWIALRRRRGENDTRSVRALATRAGAGAVVLGIGAVVAIVGAPLLPGSDPATRAVLRDHVTPPFDISAYPSPLVGFRKYTADAKLLYDQTLFTVHGLPSGIPVRIATLDNYDGSVWGAVNVPGDDFQRIGATMPVSAAGPTTTVRVTIAPAYASAGDVNAWLPNAGQVGEIDFTGADATELAAGFRFNLATSSGIVPGRLRAGGTYSFRTVADDPVAPADAQPYGPPQLTDGYGSLVAARAAEWSKGANGPGPQLRAVASYLAADGAYSDGGPGFTTYLPGHSVGRLAPFFNDPRPVGDDEQYSAALALIANYLGMPARVVLGALPESDGTVRGSDVHAWIEVHLADGRWAAVTDKQFMPPTTRKPDQLPPTQAQSTNAAVVPPPNAIHPPSSYVDDGTSATQNGTSPPAGHRGLPALLRDILVAAAWTGPPIAVVLGAAGCIVGWKARRRRRRRTTGSPANRLAQGWLELVDQARDLGDPVPSGWTRRQEAAALARHGIGGLADIADTAVYGPGEPTGDAVTTFWRHVDRGRRAMTRDVDRRRRVRALVSTRSLRRRAAASALEGVPR